jgi:hypothetical protein
MKVSEKLEISFVTFKPIKDPAHLSDSERAILHDEQNKDTGARTPKPGILFA